MAWCRNGWQLKLIGSVFKGFKPSVGMKDEGA